MDQFESIRVTGPLSGESILDVGLSIDLGHLVHVLTFKLILLGLINTNS